MSIVQIENKKCHKCSNLKTPVKLVIGKLIMSLDGLHTFNYPRQIDHTKCTILANNTVVLDAIFQNYFQESLFVYFTKWFQRNPLWAKWYVTLMGMVQGNYALCLHAWNNYWA